MKEKNEKRIKRWLTEGLQKLDEDADSVKRIVSESTDLLGYPMVENEELTWNGNREEMEARKQAKEEEDNGSLRGIEIDIVRET